MSSPKGRKRNGRRSLAVGQDGRSKHGFEPFASIPATLLANPRFCALSGSAQRQQLLFEAAWRESGKEWFLPVARAANLLGASPNTVIRGRRELEAAGFIVLVSKGVRPGQAGGQSGKGRSAIYRLPHREKKVNRNDWGWWQPNDPAPCGAWRIHVDALRNLVAKITDAQCQTLLPFHAVNRTPREHRKITSVAN